MIGFAHGLIVDQLLAPQADPSLGERRAYVDPEARPLDVESQELDALAVSSQILRVEIGGTLVVRHTSTVALDVRHGDPAEATRLRDLIVLDVVRRAMFGPARDAILSASDPATGQTVEALTVGPVDYTPLGTSDTNASAVLTFDVDVETSG